ncbi:MAG TPA: TIGR00341 family protein, partial [Oceanicaulis sp.]|nr:TIGR00341 family protein [Oceanicaulis sp.]
ASVPRLEENPDEETRTKRRLALREEMYQDIAKGAEINSDFLMLTALSTVVVVFGLSADNVAAVIGAMVIAPLLGPILAFSFGSALGDLALMLKAAKTAVTGLALGLALSFVVGLIYEPNLFSDELMSRTVVGPDSAALALAAGAAAALSIATGLPAALVGVMVAVALLPPASAAGLLAGSGAWELAGRATLLLSINVVAVNLSALMVYYFKGVRPRTWLERRSAKRSVYVNAGVWITLIVILSALAAHFAATGGEGVQL